MISQLLFGILAVFASFMVVGYKRRRIWPILMLIIVSGLFFLYFNDVSILVFKKNAYLWLNYPHLQSKFSLLYTPEMCQSLNYILISVWILLWVNAFNYIDDYPLSAGNVQLLLLSAFIFMFSAQDFMQLMAGSCCFSILGFYQINDNKAKTKFIFYNFAAEMAIFTSLAIVYAKMNEISLSSLAAYSKKGWHKDLVAILILLGVFVKCGVFLFQNQFLNLKNLSINRLLGASLLASPLSGLVLYFKLMPLIKVSSCATIIVTIITFLTFIVSLSGLWWQNDLKNKMLYFCISFFAFSLYCLHFDILTIHQIMKLLPLVLIINFGLFLCFYGYFHKINVFITMLLILLFVYQLLSLQLKDFVYVGLVVSGLSVSLHKVFFDKVNCRSISPLSNFADYLLLLVMGGIFVSSTTVHYSEQFVLCSGIFIIIFLFVPQIFYNFLSSQKWFQEKDWLSSLYEVLIISPLRLLGRLLWVLIDFVLIERGLIGKISEYGSEGVLFLRKIQDTSVYNWFWIWLLGIVLLLINIGRYAYE